MSNITKSIGIFLVGLMIIVGIGSASATNSDTVVLNSSIPYVIGMTVTEDKFTFPLLADGLYKNANEGTEIHFVTTGNTPMNIFGKVASTTSGISYKVNGRLLGISDILMTDAVLPGTTRAETIQAMAPIGKAPGSFSDTMTVTAVQV